MLRACGRCGKIHAYNHKCNVGRVYKSSSESKLRSLSAWTNKSKEIRDKANNLCEVCRDHGEYVYDNIEVHHITKIRDNNDLLLDNYNLVCLCPEHHRQADRGEIDAEYLRTLAEKREGTPQFEF